MAAPLVELEDRHVRDGAQDEEEEEDGRDGHVEPDRRLPPERCRRWHIGRAGHGGHLGRGGLGGTVSTVRLRAGGCDGVRRVPGVVPALTPSLGTWRWQVSKCCVIVHTRRMLCYRVRLDVDQGIYMVR